MTIENPSGDIEISPTMANTGTISIEINRSATGTISADSGITVTQLNPTIKFTVNVNGAKGKTFKAKFNLDPDAPPSMVKCEAESLTATTVSGHVTTNQRHINASGGYWSYTDTDAEDEWVKYTVNVSTAGTYIIKVGVNKYHSRGKIKLYIDGSGTEQGQEMDCYSSGTAWQEFDLGNVALAAGDRSFRFKVTVKNASSGGYKIGIDYITLELQ